MQGKHSTCSAIAPAFFFVVNVIHTFIAEPSPSPYRTLAQEPSLRFHGAQCTGVARVRVTGVAGSMAAQGTLGAKVIQNF